MAGRSTTKPPPVTRSGDREAPPNAAPWGPLDEAKTYEAGIAEEAAALRGAQFRGLTFPLFLKLWPLLRRPLPAGFITHTTAGKGKPYESDGARSVQVLVDRMNNVLTPLCWDYEETYSESGKLCHVVVVVADKDGGTLVRRSSWGGVNQGSTTGNIYKGSFTNAAKIAFARIGPGHEIYLGALDLDPDVNPEIAKLQDRKSTQREKATDGAKTTGDVRTVDQGKELEALLAEDSPLKAKRKQADDGMKIAGSDIGQRLEYLRGAPDERSLDSLIAQIDAYLREQEGGGGS